MLFNFPWNVPSNSLCTSMTTKTFHQRMKEQLSILDSNETETRERNVLIVVYEAQLKWFPTSSEIKTFFNFPARLIKKLILAVLNFELCLESAWKQKLKTQIFRHDFWTIKQQFLIKLLFVYNQIFLFSQLFASVLNWWLFVMFVENLNSEKLIVVFVCVNNSWGMFNYFELNRGENVKSTLCKWAAVHFCCFEHFVISMQSNCIIFTSFLLTH